MNMHNFKAWADSVDLAHPRCELCEESEDRFCKLSIKTAEVEIEANRLRSEKVELQRRVKELEAKLKEIKPCHSQNLR